MGTYKPIPHPSDLALIAEGADLKEAFEAAALGMFAFITNLDKVAEKKFIKVSAGGEDKEALLVNFLNELIFLEDAKGILVKAISILDLTETSIEAEVVGENYNPKKHQLTHSIKAATYNQLKVDQQKDRVEITVVFDV
ncbi:MAG: archease [Candidatus Margulisbacteria bacterium]|nr:archease [Candidatus Margulisiibacteriota bacterium]MBU1021932.1 archease [Candidatus Margulisiibacteriota bacterium]MBU1728911.1 archease [Candidatus Margulisiibacteriota bacterium]MBU1954717.1 archease [Candidatus Margulisiibacteriota bacterium]